MVKRLGKVSQLILGLDINMYIQIPCLQPCRPVGDQANGLQRPFDDPIHRSQQDDSQHHYHQTQLSGAFYNGPVEFAAVHCQMQRPAGFPIHRQGNGHRDALAPRAEVGAFVNDKAAVDISPLRHGADFFRVLFHNAVSCLGSLFAHFCIVSRVH